MNLLFRWCFLALMTASLFACEKDNEDTPNANEPTSNPTYEINGNWIHSGRYAGWGNTSFRADRWQITKLGTEELRIELGSQVRVLFWIYDKDEIPVVQTTGSLNINKTIESLDTGYYEIVVFTNDLIERGALSYNLKFYGNITKPLLSQSKTLDYTDLELPADSVDPNKSTWLHYQIDFDNSSKNDAIDLIANSTHDLQIQFFKFNRWQHHTIAFEGKQVLLLMSGLDVSMPFYFRIAAKYNTTPPKSRFDLSVNARAFTLTSHGTTDPT